MDRSFRVRVNQILYFILIFGAVFMDCPTGITFGLFGRCWLGIAIPFMFIALFLIKGSFRTNKYINRMISLIIWILVGSLLSNLFHIIQYGGVHYLGENIFLKTVKTCFYWIAIAMYMILILECVRNKTKKEILRPFICAFIFLFVILLIELKQMPNAFLNFHYNAFVGSYNRVRLTTTESSTTVPLIICYGYISLYYAFYLSKSKILKILVSTMMILFVVTSGSKTLLLMCIATILVILWVNHKRIPKAYIPVTCVGVIAGIVAVVGVSMYLWSRMMENAGSTATRGIQVIAAIAHALKYPFGNGGAAYMASYKRLLQWAYVFVRNTSIGSQLNYWEILGQIRSTDDSMLGVIAGIWQLSLYIGICGVGYWLWFTWKYLKNIFLSREQGSWILKAILIDVIVMWLFTTTMYNVYYMWAVILLFGLDVFSNKSSIT
ncbi:MAG: hypothetical protein ACI4E5_14245 [Suilimivivens sp.]